MRLCGTLTISTVCEWRNASITQACTAQRRGTWELYEAGATPRVAALATVRHWQVVSRLMDADTRYEDLRTSIMNHIKICEELDRQKKAVNG